MVWFLCGWEAQLDLQNNWERKAKPIVFAFQIDIQNHGTLFRWWPWRSPKKTTKYSIPPVQVVNKQLAYLNTPACAGFLPMKTNPFQTFGSASMIDAMVQEHACPLASVLFALLLLPKHFWPEMRLRQGVCLGVDLETYYVCELCPCCTCPGPALLTCRWSIAWIFISLCFHSMMAHSKQITALLAVSQRCLHASYNFCFFFWKAMLATTATWHYIHDGSIALVQKGKCVAYISSHKDFDIC